MKDKKYGFSCIVLRDNKGYFIIILNDGDINLLLRRTSEEIVKLNQSKLVQFVLFETGFGENLEEALHNTLELTRKRCERKKITEVKDLV